jgi:hypothetical protein
MFPPSRPCPFPPRGSQSIPRSRPRSPPRAGPYFWSAALPFPCRARIAGMTGLPLLIDVPGPIYGLSMLIRPVPPPSARIVRHRVFAETSSLGEGSIGRWRFSSLAHLPPTGFGLSPIIGSTLREWSLFLCRGGGAASALALGLSHYRRLPLPSQIHGVIPAKAGISVFVAGLGSKPRFPLSLSRE